MDINLDEIEDDEKFEQIFSTIEIKLFTIAYSLRKLVDTKKVSDKLSDAQLKVSVYQKNSKRLTLMNNHRFEEQYNFDKKDEEKLKIRDVCNQIIHSYIFQLVGYRSKIFYVFFNSDHQKNECLFKLKIKDFLKVVEKFANNYPSSISMIYCEDLKDYKVSCK
ncbi:hypothetical protein N9L24_03765 [Candidatus Marinamargulisbacteria bacterium]|nr:hypothetical protein [Candidatus Marinamargulisbacteria bacterium]